MILVSGATGEFGKQAITSLIHIGVEPSEISALVRNKDKAKGLTDQGINLKLGDYMNYESLVKAFNGVDSLLFVSGSEVETREIQHKNVVNAAKEAGIKRIIYTSFIRNTAVEDSAIAFLQDTHLKTENIIKTSGINYTILQNALYMDLLPVFVGENVLNTGIVLPAKNGKSNSVLRSELAEAAAKITTTTGHDNNIYQLVNNAAVSYQDVAQIITKISSKLVSYTSPSPEDYQKNLKENGVPEAYISMFTAFSVAQSNGELEVYDNTLEKILGRKPTTAEAYLTSVYA